MTSQYQIYYSVYPFLQSRKQTSMFTVCRRRKGHMLNMYCSLIWKSNLNCTTASETDMESTRLWSTRKLWTSM